MKGKFDEFDKSWPNPQTKTIQISTYNYNLLAESIHSSNFISSNVEIENLPNFNDIKASQYTVCSTESIDTNTSLYHNI